MTETKKRPVDYLLFTVHEERACALGGFSGAHETTEPACQDPGAARLIAAWLNDEHAARENSYYRHFSGRCCYDPDTDCHAYACHKDTCMACIGAIIRAGAAWPFKLHSLPTGMDPAIDAARVLAGMGDENG